MDAKHLTRRTFLKAIAGAAGVGVLAACGAATSTTPTPDAGGGAAAAPTAAPAAPGRQHRRQADRPLPVLVVRGRQARRDLACLCQGVQRRAPRDRGQDREHPVRRLHHQDDRRRAVGQARRRHRDGHARAGAAPDQGQPAGPARRCADPQQHHRPQLGPRRPAPGRQAVWPRHGDGGLRHPLQQGALRRGRHHPGEDARGVDRGEQAADRPRCPEVWLLVEPPGQRGVGLLVHAGRVGHALRRHLGQGQDPAADLRADPEGSLAVQGDVRRGHAAGRRRRHRAAAVWHRRCARRACMSRRRWAA